MLKLQLVVVGGVIEEVPEFYKDQVRAELHEDGLDTQSLETLLVGDVPADLKKPEGTVYAHDYKSVKNNSMVRVTINLLNGRVTADRAY